MAAHTVHRTHATETAEKGSRIHASEGIGQARFFRILFFLEDVPLIQLLRVEDTGDSFFFLEGGRFRARGSSHPLHAQGGIVLGVGFYEDGKDLVF